MTANDDHEHRPVVRVEPLGVEIEVRPGETLIEAAWREGYHWPTVCFGQADCTVCHVVVLEGSDNLSAIASDEEAALEVLSGHGRRNVTNHRLACRLEVHGPAVVRKRGVRREVPGA